MLITSIIKDSFQEYEGYQSLVLFSHGCNLRCPECYNLKDVLDKDKIIGEAIQVIDDNLNPMHEAVVFLGGEPTIWGNDLIDALKYVKSKGLKTKVFTNGLNYKVITELIALNIVDSFSVDFKTTYENHKEVIGIEDEDYISKLSFTITSLLFFEVDFEVRTTNWESVDIESVKNFIKNKWGNSDIKHIIQKPFTIGKV